MGFGPAPRQEFCHAIHGVICDAGKDGAKVGPGINAVELGGFDEGVDGGGPFASGIRSCEQPVLTAECYAADGSLGGIVSLP